MQSSTTYKIAILKTDRGGEFLSSEFNNYLLEHGIAREMGPPESPQQNSVVERFNRTLSERLRCQLFHGNLPPKLWGEVALATSYSINLCPSKSVSSQCPEYEWQRAAHHSENPTVPYHRLKAIGCLAYTIPPGHHNKLQPRSTRTILVGYEKNSSAYRLWDPSTNRVMVSNDVLFDENTFPLRDNINDDPADLSVLNDDVWDEIWQTPAVNSPNTNAPITHPTLPPTPDESPPVRAPRQRNTVSRLGNLIAYHTIQETSTNSTPQDDDGIENDSPTFSKAMKGPHREAWLQAMSKEFSSLQAHGVGTLVKPPPDANILPGMWRLKRKRDKFGRITTYKARWVAGGNHQIQGLDFDSTYASVGLTDSLRTLYALAAADDLEMQAFDIETAFLNGNMSHDVYVRQVTGF